MATLSSQQLDMFKEILRERREQLRRLIHDALIATNRDDYLELAGSVHDAGDESVANLLQGLNLAQREREVEEPDRCGGGAYPHRRGPLWYLS